MFRCHWEKKKNWRKKKITNLSQLLSCLTFSVSASRFGEVLFWMLFSVLTQSSAQISRLHFRVLGTGAEPQAELLRQEYLQLACDNINTGAEKEQRRKKPRREFLRHTVNNLQQIWLMCVCPPKTNIYSYTCRRVRVHFSARQPCLTEHSPNQRYTHTRTVIGPFWGHRRVFIFLPVAATPCPQTAYCSVLRCTTVYCG